MLQQIRPRWYRPAESERAARESRVRSAVDCAACVSLIENACCRQDSATTTRVGPPPLEETARTDSELARNGHDPESSGSERHPATESELVAQHDAGMSTVEYAVGTVVAAAFAAVLYRIVTGDSVISGLTNLINTALSTSF